MRGGSGTRLTGGLNPPQWWTKAKASHRLRFCFNNLSLANDLQTMAARSLR
jgi:hypothetical protein